MAVALSLLDEIIDKVGGDLRSGGFNRIVEKDTNRTGLFIEYNLETLPNEDLACFSQGCMDGIYDYLKRNDIISCFDPQGLRITPQPPTTTKNARFYVGYLIKSQYENDEQQMDKIKQFQTEQFKLKTLNPPKWFVYRFKGRSGDLSSGWKAALNALQQKGLKPLDADTYFEQRIDLDSSAVDLYIGIA